MLDSLQRPRSFRPLSMELLDRRVVYAIDAAVWQCSDASHVVASQPAVESVHVAQAGDAGNTLKTAHNFGTITRTQTVDGFVGGRDPGDMFKFTVAHNKVLKIHLTQLDSNADLALLNAKGRVLATAHQPGIYSDRIEHLVGPGTYYVHVIPRDKATSFHLTIFPSSDIPKF
jgi:hypothetical protein